MEERLQFDSSLGGNVEIPDDVNILRFAAARSKEINVMTECILEPCRTKLVFQSLPVHMRRRVMSHATNRLPRKARIAHSAQQNRSGVPLSRKKRRRLRNLMERTAHRRLSNRWLETHIWHAKRFHMTKRWGYSLPEAPCDKAFRACYRASSAHCLLQDISYYKCIEIVGPLNELITGFKKITSPKCGMTIVANAYIKGQREGSAFIFKVDKYPYECIGKVMFLWKPTDDDESLKRCIWIFGHPSLYNKLVDLFKTLFQLTPNEKMETSIVETGVKRRKLDLTGISKIYTYESYSNNNVNMTELKDSLNRFRLTGPLSHSVLVEALNIIQANGYSKMKDWFYTYVQNDENLKVHQIQSEYWNKIKHIRSPADLRCHTIVGLNVEDPRIGLPVKRTKAVIKPGEEPELKDLIVIPETLCQSQLWNSEIRKIVYDKKISTFEINKRRHDTILVPGEACKSYSDVPSIPIILIQRPGSVNAKYKRLGYNSGWDLIVPGGYGMPFWLSFILRGARTGGLRETTKLAFESGVHDVQPDTEAGKEEELHIKNILLKKYFKLPPKKRVNFIKFAIKTPFHCPWSSLLNDWNDGAKQDSFYVLRDKKQLEELQKMVTRGTVDSSFDWHENCLVPVRLFTEHKGKMTDFALICLPKSTDQISNQLELVEPLRKDKNKSERCTLRATHKALLKHLRRKAVRRKRKILEAAKKYVKVPKQNNFILNEEYALKMRELWLPSDENDVKNQCSREVVGYVTKGEFSFTEAKSSGIGYVVLASLPRLIEQNSTKKCFVLTRNTTSRQYSLATLEIILIT